MHRCSRAGVMRRAARLAHGLVTGGGAPCVRRWVCVASWCQRGGCQGDICHLSEGLQLFIVLACVVALCGSCVLWLCVAALCISGWKYQLFRVALRAN